MPNRDYHQLLLAHQSSLYAFIRSVVPGHVPVDDILQEANMTLLQKEQEYEPGSNFKAFAFQIARFKILSSLRDARRADWLLVDSDLCEHLLQDIAEHPMASPEAQDALRRCLDKLPPSQAELVRSRYWDGLQLREIAGRLRRSEGSLQQLFFRIRQRLKECVQFQTDHPERP